jgi:tripartite-type tricarboxylate transporter receptor subunit TctC
VHVPYKGGAPALGGLLAGEVDCALIAVSTAVAQLGGGKIKALAVTSGAPTQRLPGVPSLSTVVPGYDALNFHGLHGPAGMPPAIVKRLADEVRKAVHRPDVRERFDGLAMEVAGSSPQEFDAYIRKQIAIWGTFVKAAGIKAE